MKTFFLFLLLLLGAGALRPAHAQPTPAADWASVCAGGPPFVDSGFSSYYFNPKSVTVDGAGNVYVLGTFTDIITIGTATLQATQTYSSNRFAFDYYLAKFDAQGQVQWAAQLGDGQSVTAVQLVADNAGTLYLTGSFNSYSAQFGAGGPILYNSSNNSEGFVARFSGQNGRCQWARRFGGTGRDGGNSLALNSAGELYLVGSLERGPADLGPFTLGGGGLLAKLSAAGTWLWAQPSKIGISNLLFDGAGSFYAVGSFASPGITLGTTTLTINALSGGTTGYDVLIAKYTENGTLRWARQANPGGSHSLSLYQAAYDGQGHLYLAGNFGSQTATLGPFTLTNAGPLYPQPTPAPPYPNLDRYYSDAFVARYDTAGTWQWATRRGSASADDYASAVVLDGAARPWVRYISSVATTQLGGLDPTSGNWNTTYTLPVAFPSSFVLTRDQLGYLYVAGSFTGPSLSLGPVSVPGVGGTYATGYVARLGAQALPTHPAATAGTGLQVWPSPGPGTGLWVQGAKAGQVVQAFDVLGRQVGQGTMPASGPLRLSWAGAGLAPGVYILRGGAQSCRWVVES